MTTTLDTLRYDIKHMRDPIAQKSDDWKDTADQWLVTFRHNGGFFTVDYWTGIGHRKAHSNGMTSAKKPDIKDILYGLYMDSQAEHCNFINWCADYGYSDDSMKALDMYKACIENGRKLRKLGFDRDYLDELFMDY